MFTAHSNYKYICRGGIRYLSFFSFTGICEWVMRLCTVGGAPHSHAISKKWQGKDTPPTVTEWRVLVIGGEIAIVGEHILYCYIALSIILKLTKIEIAIIIFHFKGWESFSTHGYLNEHWSFRAREWSMYNALLCSIHAKKYLQNFILLFKLTCSFSALFTMFYFIITKEFVSLEPSKFWTSLVNIDVLKLVYKLKACLQDVIRPLQGSG